MIKEFFKGRIFRRKDDTLYWTSQDGRKIPIDELELAHATNILILLEKSIPTSPWIVDSKIYKAIKDRVMETK